MKSDWERLFAASPSASIFQAFPWIDAWIAAYGQKSLFAISCFYGSRLIGVLPLYIAAWPKSTSAVSIKVLRLAGDSPDDAGALGNVVEEGWEEAFAFSAVDWLEGNRSGWDALELNDLSQERADTAFRDEVRRRGWAARLSTVSRRVLHVSSWKEDHVSDGGLRRAVNRLNSRKLDYQRAETNAQVSASLEHLFHLHTERWKAKGHKGAFAIAGRRTFYRLLAVSMSEAGTLDLWTLKLDQQVVAAEFGLIRGETRYSLLSGFDPKFGRYRVGSLLDRHIVESMRQRGLSQLDFLGGDEKYKESMGAISSDLVQFRCAPPRTIGAAWVRGSSVRTLQHLWAAVMRLA